MKYKVKAGDDAWGEWTTSNLTYQNGSFEIKNLGQGAQIIAFQLVDKAGTTHESAASGKLGAKLKYGTNAYYSDDTQLYVKVDTTSPAKRNIKYAVSTDGTEYDDDNAVNDIAKLNLGGIYKKLKITLEAKDSNGIKKAELWVTKNSESVEAAETTTGTAVTTGTDDDKTYSVYTLEFALDSKTGTVFDYNGTYDAEIRVTDNADLSASENIKLKIDNENPNVLINAPEGTVKTAVTVSGSIENEKPSVYYALSTGSDEDSQPGDTAVTRTVGASAPASTAWVLISDDSYSWDVRFDGATKEGEVHSKQLRNYLIDLGFCTEATLDLVGPSERYNEPSDVYFWIKAEDASGNVTYENCKITVDPQGDRPDVSISYPATDGLKLGGTIQLMGTATDNVSAKYAWLQIYKADGSWNADALKYVSGKNYTIGKMSDNSAVTAETINGLANDANVSDYAIMTEVTGTSWSLPINAGGEFNPESGTKDYKLVFYATDTGPNQSIPITRSITIDKDTPVFVQTSLKLVQYETSAGSGTACTDGTVLSGTAVNTMDYTADVSLKGIWILTGSITDDTGLEKIVYNGATVVDKTADGGAVQYGSNTSNGYFTAVSKGSGQYNYNFSIPVGSNAEGTVGTTSVSIEVWERKDNSPNKASMTFTVQYDNMAPTVASSTENGYDIDKSIINTNGFYTFGSVAYENSVGGTAQTGVSRVAFFFTNGATESAANTVYDIMVKRGETGNELATSGLTKVDGLYWKEVSVSSVATTAVTLSAEQTFVHTGGLVKMNGSIYTIKSVSGTVMTLDGQPGTASKALVAIACVVDNDKQEGIGSGTTDAAGYYTNGAYDDGDHMPESLVKQGTSWTWEANIKSNNIADGPVTLHYVVFDKAGNVSINKVENCTVQNNGPRIARVKVGTDEDGNGTVENGEMSYTSELFDKGYNGSRKNIEYTFPPQEAGLRSAVTAKGAIRVVPEIVGGNGNLYYSYRVAKRTDDGWEDDGDEPEDKENAYYKKGLSANSIGVGSIDDVTTVTLNAMDISVKDMLTAVNGKEIEDGDYQKFTFTIWDSTPNTVAGSSSQHADISIIMNVALRDNEAPKAKILPFYWNTKDDNSLFGKSKDNGHIELSGDLPKTTDNPAGVFGGSSSGEFDLDPKVSGKIKIEGLAYDNAVLNSISFKLNKTFGSIDADDTTVMANYAGGIWTPESALSNGDVPSSGWATSVQQATYGELVKAGIIDASIVTDDISKLNTTMEDGTEIKYLSGANVPYASQDFGHIVHWILYLDTSKISGTADKDVTVTVTAKDQGKPTLSGTSVVYNNGKTSSVDTVQTGGNDGSGTLSGFYKMDVVPYITGLKRSTNQTDTHRSNRGKYQVVLSESVTIAGFNLPGTASGAIKLQTTGNQKGETVKTQITAKTGSTKDSMTFSVPGTSGYIKVITNNVSSINNFNSSSEYNKMESDYSGDEWYDDVYLSVWKNDEYFAGSPDPISPAMDRIAANKKNNNYNADVYTLYGGWAANSSKFYASYPDSTSTDSTGNAPQPSTGNFGDPASYYDVVIDASGNLYHCLLDCWQGQNSGNNGYWGRNFVINKNGSYSHNGTNASTNATTDNIIERMGWNLLPEYETHVNGYDAMFNQFLNPRITYKNNYAYLTYYDRYAKCLKFASMQFNTNNNNRANKYSTEGGNYTNGKFVVAGYETLQSGGTKSAMDVGIWSSIVVDSETNKTDSPVIAYYDTKNKQLMIATANTRSQHPENSNNNVLGNGTTITEPTGGTNPGEGNAWNHTVVTGSAALRLGQYVSMAIDGGMNLHIAAYGTAGGNKLYYIYGEKNSYGDYDFTITCVDAEGAGTWTDIQLENPTGSGAAAKPVISYYDPSNDSSENAVKVAYLDNGEWDAMTAPLASSAVSNRVTLAVNVTDGDSLATTTTNNSKLAIGYVSSRFDVVYLRKE